MSWRYHNPVQIDYGQDQLTQALEDLREAERADVFLITTEGSTRRGISERVRSALGGRLRGVDDSIRPNPPFSDAEALFRRHFAEERPGIILAIGGGSVIDTAKGVVAVCFREEGRGIVPPQLWAVPTTAGTGSEVTPFAAFWDMDEHRKSSLLDPRLYPVRAILDPALTTALPPDVTIAGGLDALVQCFDSWWNASSSAITCTFAAKGLTLALSNLLRTVSAPEDLSARGSMLRASLFSGLAISNTKTSICHAISYPLTIHFGLSHGYACAFALPGVLNHFVRCQPRAAATLAEETGFSSTAELVAKVEMLLASTNLSEKMRGRFGPQDVGALVPEMWSSERRGNAPWIDDEGVHRAVENSCSIFGIG